MILTRTNEPYAQTLMPFADDRGVFQLIEDGDHSMKLMAVGDKLTKVADIKRVYTVVNTQAGIIRGFHYHEKEWKLFAILNGSAKFVALDPNVANADSDPLAVYNSAKTFVSSTRVPKLIVVPPRWANGWISLEPNTILLSLSSSTTKESIADDKRFDPYKWGNLWKIKAR